MTLRLDPDIPLVWRTTTSLQLGGLAPVAIFPEVSRDEELLLAALRRGVTRDGLGAIGAVGRMPPGAVDEMLARVGQALIPDPGAPAALVVGDGPLARALDGALRASGRVPSPGRARLAVLVAPWLVLPADAAVWLRRDVPHLPVVVGDRIVSVGPLVHPGTAPCLHCVERHRLDEDPTRVAVAAQLLGLPAPNLGPLAMAHALSLAARVAVDALEDRAAPGLELRVDTGTGAVSERVWAPHPECRCAAPPGSDWAPVTVLHPGRRAAAPSGGRGGSSPG